MRRDRVRALSNLGAVRVGERRGEETLLLMATVNGMGEEAWAERGAVQGCSTLMDMRCVVREGKQDVLFCCRCRGERG